MSINRSSAVTAIIATLILALQSSLPAQDRAADIRAEVERKKQDVAARTRAFLDRARSVDERADAIAAVSTVIDPQQIALMVRVVRDSSESPHLRALAVARIQPAIFADTVLVEQLLAMLRNAGTPRELRLASMWAVEVLTIGSMSLPPKLDQILATLRALMNDRDAEIQARAFGILAALDDNVARDELLRRLESRSDGLIPPHQIAELLGLRLNQASLPALHRLMLRPPDAATRIAAVRLVGGYDPSVPELIRLVREPSAPEDLRLAALQSLYAAVPHRLNEFAAPIVADESASDPLRVYSINAARYRRFALQRAPLAVSAVNSFDQIVKRLASSSRSDAVRKAAAGYVTEHGIR